MIFTDIFYMSYLYFYNIFFQTKFFNISVLVLILIFKTTTGVWELRTYFNNRSY